MPSIFETIAERASLIPELLKTTGRSIQAGVRAEEVKRRLESARAVPSKKPAIGEDVISRFKPPQLITGEEAPIRAGREIGEEVKRGIAPLIKTAEEVPKTVFNTFEAISRAGGAIAQRYGLFAEPEAVKPLEVRKGEGVFEALKSQPTLAEVTKRGLEKTPASLIPGLPAAGGFLSESLLLPPYGAGKGGNFIKLLARNTEKGAVKNLLLKGVKNITEEEAEILSAKIAPITDRALVKKEIESFAAEKIPIAKELEPLAAEARKYKNAEEFGKTLDKPTIGKLMATGSKEVPALPRNAVQSLENPNLYYVPKGNTFEVKAGKVFEYPPLKSEKQSITDFYNQAVKGEVSGLPSKPALGDVPGEVSPRPEPPTPPEKIQKGQIPEKERALEPPRAVSLEKEYYKETPLAKTTDLEQADAKLHPTELKPENAGLYRKFKNSLESKWTSFVEYVQDDFTRVRNLISRKDVNVNEASNVSEKEILYRGRLATRVEEADVIAKNIDKDIIDTAKKLGVKDSDLGKEVDRYLIARHAPERNAKIGEKAAGITTEEANTILKDIETSPRATEVKRIAESVIDLNRKTLTVLLDGGVIDKELYDTLTKTYKNHVPLQRIFEDTENINDVLVGRGFDVRGTGIKRAKGSEREVADIMTNVLANYKAAVARAEKNIVDNATLKFARENPHLDLFEEIKPKAIGRAFPTKGEEEGRIILERITDPQVLTLRENGKPVYLKIKDPALAVALRGIGREKLSGIFRLISSITRLYAGLATRFNPEFAFPNKIRDLQETAVYLAAQKDIGFKGTGRALIKDPISVKSVTEFVLGKDTEGARLYKQMVSDGGTTGGLGLSTRKKVELDWEDIKKINRSKPRQAAQKITEAVDNWNTIFEDSTRLSVYRQALADGLSRQRAAVLAKEASLNFNKMGRGGPVINALYMFSNASIQGSAKLLRAMKNPKVAAAVTGTITASVAAVNEWNDRVDPKWRDKVSKWDRLNGLPLLIPSKEGDGVKYLLIPASWGIKPILVGTNYAFDAMAGESKGIKDTMSAFLGAALEAYNPVGGTDITSAITPTILDLPVDVARNRAWTGNRIRPDWDVNAPPSIQYFKSLKESETGKLFIRAGEELAEARIEISPADMKYAHEQIVGGAGRAASKLVNTIAAVGRGKAPEARDIPFVSRFFRTRTKEEIGAGTKEKEAGDIKKLLQEQSRERFIEKNKAEDTYAQLKNLPKERAADAFDELTDINPDLAQKVLDIAKDEQLGFSSTDRLIKQLGVENGERAKYIFDVLGSIKSREEKADFFDEMVEKKLITKRVAEQINEMMNQ